MICTYQEDYKDILLDCFITDEDLLNKYHVSAPATLNQCVERTHSDLMSAYVQVYSLEENEEVIGYFGIEIGTYLTGFFIKPEYRNSKYIKEFWNIVNNMFNQKQFYCGVYKKNDRAIEFLKKNNGKLWIETSEGVFYVFNQGGI